MKLSKLGYIYERKSNDDPTFFISKFNSLEEKITTLTQHFVKVKEIESISKTIIDKVEQSVSGLQTDVSALLPLRATLIDQDVRLKSITDRFEVLIDYLTDNGKISMPDIQRKIISVKPAEIRTMKQNVNTLVSKSTTTDDRIVEAETKINSLTNTVTNIDNSVTLLGKLELLTLHSDFTGKLYFTKIGELGILHGTITTTTNLSSTKAICVLSGAQAYEDFLVVNKVPYIFKVTRGELFIIADRQNSGNLHFQFKHFIA